ncbi:hypothetical protein BC833DRAFT_625907 [Globomyces pollinis-pini]|nr:hypothetical protein BC833DRAFT_625907 [Globomyces pollinis-pini]
MKTKCERCKARYLKCNGESPCNGCIRYGKYSKNGMPDCIYPHPISMPSPPNSNDDASSSVISPPMSSFNNTFLFPNPNNNNLSQFENQLDKPMTDIEFLFSDQLLDFSNSNQLTYSHQTFAQLQSQIQSNSLNNNIFQQPQSSIITELNPTQNSFDNSFLTSNSQNQMMTLDSVFTDIPQLNTFNLQPQKIINENDVESHLIQLSFLSDDGFSPESDSMSATPMNRSTALSKKLKQALCFKGVFHSVHPLLFPKNKNPTFKERLQVAQQFALPSDDSKQWNHNNSQLHCDNIRALLIYGVTQYNLGDPMKAGKYISQAYQMGKQLKIFDHSSFDKSPRNGHVSVDDLVSMTSALILSKPANNVPNAFDLTERFCLWVMCFTVDTYSAISGGMGFTIDESEFPNVNFSPFSNGTPCSSLARVFEPTLAKHTIWENTHWAPLFDDMKELSNAYPKLSTDAGFRAQQIFLAHKVFRKVINFSRQNKYDVSQKNTLNTRMQLHESVLRLIMEFPSDIAILNSLTPFSYGSPDVGYPRKPRIKALPSAFEHLATCLVMFAYLHLSAVQSHDNSKFALEYGGPKVYSPQDIIFASVRALSYMIEFVSTPTVPQESIFGPYQYPYESISQCLQTPGRPTLPTPLLSNPTCSLLIFCISSSALIAFQTQPIDLTKSYELGLLIEKSILPTLIRIGSVWPTSKMHHSKLYDLIKALQK